MKRFTHKWKLLETFKGEHRKIRSVKKCINCGLVWTSAHKAALPVCPITEEIRAKSVELFQELSIEMAKEATKREKRLLNKAVRRMRESLSAIASRVIKVTAKGRKLGRPFGSFKTEGLQSQHVAKLAKKTDTK